MSQSEKRPYKKPTMTVIPAGSPRYEELKRMLAQADAASIQSDASASQNGQPQGKEADHV